MNSKMMYPSPPFQSPPPPLQVFPSLPPPLSHSFPPFSAFPPLSSDDVPLPQDELFQTELLSTHFTTLPTDIFLDTLLYLKLEDLFHFCQTEKVVRQVCQDIRFWRQRFLIDYPSRSYLLRDENFNPRMKYIQLYEQNIEAKKINILARVPFLRRIQLVDLIDTKHILSDHKILNTIMDNMTVEDIKRNLELVKTNPVTEKSLNKLSTEVLQKLARELHIDFNSTTTKTQLISTLLGHMWKYIPLFNYE